MSSDNTEQGSGAVGKLSMQGFYVVVVGLLVVLTIYVVAVLRWDSASDVTTVVGSAGGIVGTVIGAFFGVQVGSAGRDRAERQRNVAQERSMALAAALSPEQFRAVQTLRSDLF